MRFIRRISWQMARTELSRLYKHTAPQSRGFSYHFCQRISLLRSFSSASALCFITAGARSGLPPMCISATGGVIKSLGGIEHPEGCVIDVEQPAISHAITHSHIFDSVTVNHLTPDSYLGALLRCFFLAGC